MSTLASWVDKAKGYEEQFKKSDYAYLGWQVGNENVAYKQCHQAGHMQGINSNFRVVRDIQFSNRGSHCTYWCPVCKIWWNIDMSD